MLGRHCGCHAAGSTPGVSLADVFRVLGHVNSPTLPTGTRRKFFPSAIRQTPGVPVSVVNQSAWQPINVPAAVQVDSTGDQFAWPWPFDGSTFARRAVPYAPSPADGAMQAPSAGWGFSIQQNTYNTIPWILAVGQNKGG